MEGFRTKDVALVKKVLKFLPQQLFQNGAYCRGPVRTKEAHCYTFDSSVGKKWGKRNEIEILIEMNFNWKMKTLLILGPIQIGIPPETIKTSILQGESVPKVYILPSQLFLDGRILGEIGMKYNQTNTNNHIYIFKQTPFLEFPIYFNFFMKKGFANPDNRLVLVGMKEHIERVKTVFSESFYGPSNDALYMDKEIAAGKNYKINFPAERKTIASTNDKGEPTPLTDFANFAPFDSTGTIELKLKPEGM